MRSHKILPRQSRTVVEGIVIPGNTGVVQKSPQDFQSGLHRSARPFFAAEQPQENFGVQVLADFVNDLNVLRKWRGLVLCEHQWPGRGCQGVFLAAAAGSDHRAGESRKARPFSVPGALFSINCDAAHFKQVAEQIGGKLCRIVNRQAFIRPGIVHWHSAPESQLRRAGLTVDIDFPPRSSGRGHEAIVDGVVAGKGREADKSFVAGMGTRQYVHEDYIVIDGKRRYRRAFGPDQIILAPPFAIAFKCEIGVIRDHVSVDVFHALLCEFIRELLQHAGWVGVALSAHVVGKFASGKRGIAASDQDQVSRKTAVFIQ